MSLIDALSQFEQELKAGHDGQATLRLTELLSKHGLLVLSDPLEELLKLWHQVQIRKADGKYTVDLHLKKLKVWARGVGESLNEAAHSALREARELQENPPS